MITTVCKISYGSQTVPPIVPAVQGDTGRAISFEIADFTPPAGATATYFILKPSGEAIYNSATITDNSILCELTAQSLAEAGENRMQVRVLHGEDIVTSFEVILMVRTFLGDDAIESGTEMNIFDQAVEQATEQFQENAEQIVEEVIESIPEDYTELTEEVDELNERLSYVVEEEYEDITSTLDWSVNGYYNSGDLSTELQTGDGAKTAFLNVDGGETFRISGISYYLQKLFCIYDENDTRLAVYNPGNINTSYTNEVVQIPSNAVKVGVAYYRVGYLASLKIEKLSTHRVPVEKSDLQIFNNVEPTNYYDYKSAIIGKYINYNGTESDNSGMCYAYVPVEPGNYLVTTAQNYFGSTAAQVPYFDANKQYLGWLQGTFESLDIPNLAITSITVPNSAKYITISLRTYYRFRGYAVKGSAIPSIFPVYFNNYDALENDIKVDTNNIVGNNKNPLFLKTVAFDGDSICHGISADDNKSGWAGRIGTANNMNWCNYGISGGTITNNHSHCILNTLNDIHKFMPTVDYYIFDGGTNDADILGMNGIGTVTADDFGGTYDTSTFSGAFETLLYNALTYYPTTKIGYIVAQKMGKTNNANYPIRKAFFDRAIEICKKWGVPYVDLWDGSHLNPNLASMYDSSLDASGNIASGKMYIDGQHLTPNGYDYITHIIEAWMKTI